MSYLARLFLDVFMSSITPAINLVMDADYSAIQEAQGKFNPRQFATIESITAPQPYLTYFTQSK